MELALIIGGSVIAGLVLIAFVVWAHQYTKVGPNEVLIISGRRRKERGLSPRARRRHLRASVPRAGARLSLELMQFDVRTSETYSAHGVPVQVDGVCMVKIDGTDEGIERAAEQFLSRRQEDIVRTAMQAVEGHMRSAIGGLSIEDIYRDRQRLVATRCGRSLRPTSSAWGSRSVRSRSATSATSRATWRRWDARARPRSSATRSAARRRPSARPRPPATTPTSPSSARGATTRSRSRTFARRACARRPRRTSPTSCRRRSRAAGPRRAARRGDRRAQEGDRADAGRGRSPAARARVPRSSSRRSREASKIEEIAEAEREEAAALGCRRGRRAARQGPRRGRGDGRQGGILAGL